MKFTHGKPKQKPSFSNALLLFVCWSFTSYISRKLFELAQWQQFVPGG